MSDRPHTVYRQVRGGLGRVRRRLAFLSSRRPAAPAAPPRGRAPRVERTVTNIGPQLADAVVRATRRMRIGVDEDYDLVQKNFDVLHYLLQAPRVIDRPGVDPVQNFFETGVQHHRSPDIHFSMANYLERYPERLQTDERSPYLEWLKHGQAAGEIADPAPAIPEMAHILGLPVEQLVEMLRARRSDLVDRLLTGELGRMVTEASTLEPLIGQAWHRATRPRLLPFGHPPALQQIAAIHTAHEAAGFRKARLVMVINRPRWGGGRRMEGHVAHALSSSIAAEDIVVLYTDGSGETPPGRFPAGVREIDFSVLVGHLEPEEAQAALVVLLRTFHADAIVNINSGMLYHALRTMGDALTASERLFLCFFCKEQMPIGAWTSWSMRYFYRLFERVAGVVTDSEHLARELQDTYRIPLRQRDRLQVLRAPVDPDLPFVADAPSREGRRPQVFWAGRWDRQKRVPLFLEIARSMPDVDFHMWGEAVRDGRRREIPGNVTVHGRYGHISELPLHEADAWLYTSAWDGVPSQLLEVGVTGTPLVGTLVGGTGEVLAPGEGWPVAEDAGAEAYVAALREILADPGAARARAAALRSRLLEERTQESFGKHVAGLLFARTNSEGSAT